MTIPTEVRGQRLQDWFDAASARAATQVGSSGPCLAGRWVNAEGRSVWVPGGLDDLGDDDLNDPVGVLLAGAAVLAEFDADVAGDEAG